MVFHLWLVTLSSVIYNAVHCYGIHSLFCIYYSFYFVKNKKLPHNMKSLIVHLASSGFFPLVLFSFWNYDKKKLLFTKTLKYLTSFELIDQIFIVHLCSIITINGFLSLCHIQSKNFGILFDLLYVHEIFF